MVRSFRAWRQSIEPWYFAVGLANLVLGTASVLIPLMVSQVLERSVVEVGILASLGSLMGVIGSLFWGRLSDAAHRRKPFVILSYAVVGACLVGMATVNSFVWLAILNMTLNLFWVANASVTVLIVIENRQESEWEGRLSQLNQIGAFGWVLGLGLGSLALAVGAPWIGESTAIRIVFFGIGAAGCLASILAAVRIPRTVPRFTRRRFRGVILAIGNFLSERARFAPFHLYHRLRPRYVLQQLRRPEGFRPGTLRFLAVTFLAYVGLGLFGIPLPVLLAEKFGYPSASVFLFFLIQHAAIVAAYPFAARRIRNAGNRYVQAGALLARAGLFLTSAIYLAVTASSPALPALVFAFVVYGLSWSYFQLSGVALASRLAKPENRGQALGMYNALAGAGWIVAGVVSGALTTWGGYALAFGAAAGLLGLSLAVLRTVPDPAAAAARTSRNASSSSSLRRRPTASPQATD